MPDVREVYEMVTKHKPPEPGALERQQKKQVRSARKQKIGAFAVAAAIGVAAVVVILATRGGQDAITPAEPGTDVTAEEIATGFLEAFGAFDVDQARTYLADDATIASMGANDDLRLLISWLEATGYEQTFGPCEEVSSSASGTSVRCAFDFHALRSGEIGLGPYTGSTFDLRVVDGEIVRVSQFWEIEEFSPQVWEPFADWVSTTYPGDTAVMYTDSTSNVRLTQESIRLWERRTREYVEVVGAGT
jgi:hypothetical protein